MENSKKNLQILVATRMVAYRLFEPSAFFFSQYCEKHTDQSF